MRVIASCLLAGAVVFPVAAEDSPLWSQVMQHGQGVSYAGTMVLRNSTGIKTVKVSHLAGEGNDARNIIMFLSGQKRELVHHNNGVACLLPGRQRININNPSSFVSFQENIIKKYDLNLANYYSIESKGLDRVAGRNTKKIWIVSREGDRYGYDIWLDSETGVILRSDLVASGVGVIEQFIFTDFSVIKTIPDALAEKKCVIEKNNPPVVSASDQRSLPAIVKEAKDWVLSKLPAGFVRINKTINVLENDSGLYQQHQVFSDGIAMVSVFVANKPDNFGKSELPTSQLKQMGAVSVFQEEIDGYQMTVMGEVPLNTVESIGRSFAWR